MDQESEGERRLARVPAAGGPAPHWGRWLVPGVRVDAVYPQARLVVEYDGFKHHSTSTDLDHDHRRRLRLEGAGWQVVTVTGGMLRDAPEATAAGIHAIRRRRLGELVASPSETVTRDGSLGAG